MTLTFDAHRTPQELDVTRFPAELGRLNQWVVWRYEQRVWNDEPTKVLYNARSGQRASTTSESSWSDLETAERAYKTGQYDGIGFVFGETDEYSVIDLRNCRNQLTGYVEPWAQQIVAAINSYTEISPSGTGLHIIVKGRLAQAAEHRDSIVYRGKLTR